MFSSETDGSKVMHMFSLSCVETGPQVKQPHTGNLRQDGDIKFGHLCFYVLLKIRMSEWK